MTPHVPAMSDNELRNWFTYHPPFGDQAERYGLVWGGALDFAQKLLRLTPPSPEQREAIHYLRLAVMCAKAAIACNEKEPPPPPPKLGIPLGVNLAGPAEWNTDVWCTNALKQGTEWYSQVPGKSFDEGKRMPMPLSPAGYPAQLDKASGQFAETLLYVGMPGHHLSGPHVLTWEGSGRVEVNDDGVLLGPSETGSPAAEGGVFKFTLRPDSTYVAVRIRETDPRNHVRNVRLCHQQHADRSAPWLPYLPELLKGMKCVRFMDWTMTNRAQGVVKWSDRAAPGDATWVKAGVPYEVCLQLADSCQVVPWLCVPHEADDDYVRNLASLIGASPCAQVFVEYSNECWNDRQVQAGWCRWQGVANHLSSEPTAAGMRFYAQRAREVMRLMLPILGKRIVRVIAWNHQDPFLTNMACDWADAKAEFDVLAVAPYFGHGDAVVAKMPGGKTLPMAEAVSLILKACSELIELNRSYTRDQKKVADDHGLRLVAYEAGQHLVAPYDLADADAQVWTDLFRRANADPRMKGLYEEYARTWAADGGELMNLFTLVSKWTRDGCWGLMEYIDHVGSPKWEALQALLRS
jgi:hypothetical protein